MKMTMTTMIEFKFTPLDRNTDKHRYENVDGDGAADEDEDENDDGDKDDYVEANTMMEMHTEMAILAVDGSCDGTTYAPSSGK